MIKCLNFLSLFGSISTLLCCALPVTLVTIGMGATFASLTSTFPQVTWLALHKNEVFLITGLLLITSYILLKYASREACPIELGKQEACKTGKSYSNIFFWVSVGCYSVGLLFSFVLPKFI